jgi:hypothetical protein
VGSGASLYVGFTTYGEGAVLCRVTEVTGGLKFAKREKAVMIQGALLTLLINRGCVVIPELLKVTEVTVCCQRFWLS